MPNPVDAALGRGAVGLVRGYQFFSRFTPAVCRYSPSCSAYAVQALQTHGLIRGLYLAGRRLLSCHPWSDGGYDPVPGTAEAREWQREQSERAREQRLAALADAQAAHAPDGAGATAPSSTMPPASSMQGTS